MEQCDFYKIFVWKNLYIKNTYSFVASMHVFYKFVLNWPTTIGKSVWIFSLCYNPASLYMFSGTYVSLHYTVTMHRYLKEPTVKEY